MPFYAVAVGREQKVTDDWNEAKRLTNRFPNYKLKKFDTEEQAYKWIEEFTEELNNRALNDFEDERRAVPSFFNRDFRTVPIDCNIFITTYHKKDENTRVFDEIIGDYVMKSRVIYNCLSATIVSKFHLPYDVVKTVEHKNETYYYYSLDIVDRTRDKDTTLEILLKTVSDIMRKLPKLNLKSISLNVTSNYLVSVLQKDIFQSKYFVYTNTNNLDLVQDLYTSASNLSYIYLNYYSSSLMPDELKHLINHIQTLTE